MATKKETGKVPADKLALYDKLIATNPTIERKGVKLPYTSANGNMFSFISENGLVGIRLPEDERERFLKEYHTTLFEAHGAIMKEYVTVPDGLLQKTDELKKYLDISFAYVKTLKPKGQKKPANKGKKKA
jgi:hypothetical protein